MKPEKKIVVLGNGWLGQLLAKYFDCEICSDRIIDYETALKFYKEYEPHVVINAAGVNGKISTSWCESHRVETYLGNVHLPYLLGKLGRIYEFKLVQLSTCYIDYDNSFYTRTKQMAEDILYSEYEDNDVLIARINLPIDKTPHPRNLIDKLLVYDEVFNETVHLTVMDDFCDALKYLIEDDRIGIWNCVNDCSISLAEIVNIYAIESGKKLNKIFVDSTRDVKEVISDVNMPNVLDSVRNQIKQYIKNEK